MVTVQESTNFTKMGVKARFQTAVFVKFVFGAQRHREKQSFSRCSPEQLLKINTNDK